MGILYIVPTPIGNLEDITLRALRVLRDVVLIAAEDTRTTGRLLKHYEIDTPQISYHEHTKLARLDAILDTLHEGQDVALVSDAGTPGISDPGYKLVEAAINKGINVVPLPGANAVLPALVGSGLPTDRFTFTGFLPRKATARNRVLDELRDIEHTLIFYEAPHRLVDTLESMSQVFGLREIAIARELTKLYEEIWRGTIEDAHAYYSANPPRGEITLVVAGTQKNISNEPWAEDEVRAALATRLEAGESRSAAARNLAAESGWPRRTIYDLDA